MELIRARDAAFLEEDHAEYCRLREVIEGRSRARRVARASASEPGPDAAAAAEATRSAARALISEASKRWFARANGARS